MYKLPYTGRDPYASVVIRRVPKLSSLGTLDPEFRETAIYIYICIYPDDVIYTMYYKGPKNYESLYLYLDGIHSM